MPRQTIPFLVIILACFALLIYFEYFSDDSNRYVNGIYVDGMLRHFSYEDYKIDYCKLLEKATMNDANSIRKITLLDFGDGTGYDHGAVIVGLIEFIGEDNFINSFEAINKEQKDKIFFYLKAGLAYGGKSYLKDKTIEEAFPKVYIFLKSNSDTTAIPPALQHP